MTLFRVGAFFGDRGEHVEQNISLATSSDARLRTPVRLTALRRAEVFAIEPGPASRNHAPTPERCPRQEPRGRKGLLAFTLCHKVSSPIRAPSAVPSQRKPKAVELIEKRQNKVNFSGVCHCHIRSYDKKVGSPKGACLADETSGTSTYLYQTPVQYW